MSIPVSALAIYSSFTPLHDATHRAVSSSPWLNDLIGTIAACLLVPCLSTKVYRVPSRSIIAGRAISNAIRIRHLFIFVCPGYSSPSLRPTSFGLGGGQRKLWRQRTVKERLAFFLSIGAHFVMVTGFFCLITFGLRLSLSDSSASWHHDGGV